VGGGRNCGRVVAYKYYFRAFPEASVNFKVTRGQALSGQKNFWPVTARMPEVTSRRSFSQWTTTPKTYLERELGLAQANQLMSSELNIWYWDVRFFKPQQEEEFRVRVSPSAEVVG